MRQEKARKQVEEALHRILRQVAERQVAAQQAVACRTTRQVLQQAIRQLLMKILYIALQPGKDII